MQPADQPIDDDAGLARRVVDAGRYLVLATADADGRPWPTPVWYAQDGREFVWVSRPEARHSSNIEARSTVGFVIFETPVPVESRTRPRCVRRGDGRHRVGPRS